MVYFTINTMKINVNNFNKRYYLKLSGDLLMILISVMKNSTPDIQKYI